MTDFDDGDSVSTLEDPVSGPGSRYYALVTDDFDLSPAELRILEDACRLMDMVAALEVEWERIGCPFTALGSTKQPVIHPLIQEIRVTRTSIAGLLKALKLPAEGDPDEVTVRIPLTRSRESGSRPMTRSEVGRLGASARWDSRRGRV